MGFCKAIELAIVSVHTSVVFIATIVFVVSDATITSPPTARTHAQIAPGIRNMDLDKAPDFVSGISFIVDIISMRTDE